MLRSAAALGSGTLGGDGFTPVVGAERVPELVRVVGGLGDRRVHLVGQRGEALGERRAGRLEERGHRVARGLGHFAELLALVVRQGGGGGQGGGADDGAEQRVLLRGDFGVAHGELLS